MKFEITPTTKDVDIKDIVQYLSAWFMFNKGFVPDVFQDIIRGTLSEKK